jgi:hypothetical protein
LHFLWWRGVKIIINWIFWHAATTKIIITSVPYKLQSSYGTCLKS